MGVQDASGIGDIPNYLSMSMSLGRTGVLPPFSTFVLPVLLGHPGLGERYKFNSIFAQNA